MCGGPDRIKPSSLPASTTQGERRMNGLTVDIDDAFSSLLELAANNDVDAFSRSLDCDPSAVHKVGLWYGRRKGSNRMVLEHRTPLTVAATYGSLEVLKFILSLPSVDVNRFSGGHDNTTALHCAASGGSTDAVETIKILLAAGADPTLVDANGNLPSDVIAVSPKLRDWKSALEQLLGKSSNVSSDGANHHHFPLPLSFFPDENGQSSKSSHSAEKFPDLPPVILPEKKEYPVDPSLPDIKNSIYATDEFRIFSFKIRPCSRAYSHDWTECPFVHPGENARRRDPRKYHYSCVPCPDFRKGSCRRGDMCEYAHGVFESWLHPAQYRTRLCKDGTNCNRRVCFFAHTNEELRPLYMSSGSAVPSPRATSMTMDMVVAMGFMPGSPSTVAAAMSPFTPPISPLAKAWPQPNVPTLNLPANNIESTRMQPSVSARDMLMDDLSASFDSDTQQLFNDTCYSRLNSSVVNHSIQTKTLNPPNLEDLFSAEITSSPRCSYDRGGNFSPSYKTSIINQFQHQRQQSFLSPINTSVFLPKAVDSQQLPAHSSLLQASINISSPCLKTPRSMEPISPTNSHLAILSQMKRQQQTVRSLSSRDLGAISSPVVGSPVNSLWCKWASPFGAPDWGMNAEELGCCRFELQGKGDEPDLSWFHSPEKEVSAAMATAGPPGFPAIVGKSVDKSNSNAQTDGHNQAAVLGTWLEHMQLDQIVSNGERQIFPGTFDGGYSAVVNNS